MRENKNGNSIFFTILLFTKFIFLHLSDGQPTSLRDSQVSEQGKFKTGQKEQLKFAGTEESEYVSFWDSFHKTKLKRGKIVPRIRPLHQRTDDIPGGVRDEIARALAQHIEGMEPHFKSASFQQLWSELKDPLTNVMRPRKLEELLSDLEGCHLGNALHPYEFPTDVDSIKRDLVICKIGETLENDEGSSSSGNNGDYAHIWSLLKQPLTSCFKVAELSSLMDELAQCLPRFELAGIEYEVPSKMSEVKRDVVICKVDEVFNEPYNDDGLSGSGHGA